MTSAIATANQAIVFRQHFPPRHDASILSFFGGAPVAPRDFRWPGANRDGGESTPFSFLMQIDCAAVPAAARLGLLPDRGVLYFFLDLTWAEPNAFRVVHVDGDATNWAPVQPPADLGCAYGKEAPFFWKWIPSAQDCPQLLPKWTFEPIAMAIPDHAYDPNEYDEENPPVLWPGGDVVSEALRAAQGEDVPSSYFSIEDFVGADSALRRPFPNYPHDWRAIQICCGLVLHKLRERPSLRNTTGLRDLSESARDALVAQMREEASLWLTRAASHSPFDAVPQVESDEFWSWLASSPRIVMYFIIEATTESIEASLSASPEAAARVPAGVARRLHDRHALAVRTERGLFVRIPDRMLAPPVDVQGNQWDRAKTHLLLLELSSNEGIAHHFGEGVYQFWITAEDLQARRFNKVELTTDAY